MHGQRVDETLSPFLLHTLAWTMTIHSGLFFQFFPNKVYIQLLLLIYGWDPVANYLLLTGSNASVKG